MLYSIGTGLYLGMSNQNGMSIADDPTAPSFVGTNMTIGGGATTLINATVGKGQGTWSGRIDNMTLNVTTPYQQLKKAPTQVTSPGTSWQDHQSKTKQKVIPSG